MKRPTKREQNKIWKILIDTAVHSNSTKEFSTILYLKINGETWQTYGAVVSHRDILFYCKQGTATYLVDSYGDRHVVELFDWDKDV